MLKHGNSLNISGKRFILGFIVLAFIASIYKAPPIHAVSYKTIKVPLKYDAYVESGYPNTLTFDQRNLFVGYDTIYNKKITYTYFLPNYWVLKRAGIDPSLIVDAKAYFWVYSIPQNTLNIRIYRPTGAWEETSLTFNNQPTLQYYTYKNINISQPGRIELSITNGFKQDYERVWSGNLPFGFALKLSNSSTPAFRFWSSECLQAPNSLKCESQDQIPFVKITYKDNSIPTLGEILQPVDNFKTNNKKVSFAFKQAQDPEGDILFYRIVLAKDNDFEHIYKTSSWHKWNELDKLSETVANISINVSDGVYYWRLEVKDEYSNKVASEARQLIVDTIPPSIPIVIDEPPYTKGTTNTIYVTVPNWEEGEKLEYQASPVADFSHDVISSSWIGKPYYTFTNLKALKYYYRVRSKDSLGNISKWSRLVWSIQDQSKPNIDYFKVTPTLVIKNVNTFSIKARFYDVTLYKIGYWIYKGKKLILSKEFQNQEYFWEKINAAQLPSGKYYVYVWGVDQFGNAVISKQKLIIVDKDSPKLLIKGIPKFNKYGYTKVNKFTTKISCNDSLTSTHLDIYVNNKKIYSGRAVTSYDFVLQDKKYVIKFRCSDRAGNVVYKSFSFTVDTTSPQAPRLKNYTYSKTARKVTAFCSEKGFVTFWLGNKKIIKECKKGKASVIYKYLAKGKHYSVAAYEIDLAGNKGVTSTTSFFIPFDRLPKSKKLKVSCYVKYDVKSGAYLTKQCKLLGKINLQAVGDYYKHGYRYTILGNIPHDVDLFFVLRTCKPKTLFDFRTWFGCVPVENKLLATKATLIYNVQVKGGKKVQVPNKRGLASYWFKKPPTKLRIKIKGILYSSFRYNTMKQRINMLFFRWKNPLVIDKTITPPYVAKPITYNKPFSWMFDKLYMITQWFGSTCWNPFHTGIDISVKKVPIKAVADGTVVSMGYHKGNKNLSGGYWIGIRHDNGLYTYYWHLDGLWYTKKKKIRVGTRVKRGQYIALSGNSGMWKGHLLPYHLHFEVRKTRSQRTVVDPTLYLNVNWKKMIVCEGRCCTTGNDPRKRK